MKNLIKESELTEHSLSHSQHRNHCFPSSGYY